MYDQATSNSLTRQHIQPICDFSSGAISGSSIYICIAFTNSCTKHDAALLYATAGIRVFPLSPDSKVPLLKGSWKDYATKDEAQIRTWWDLYPDANIAGVMGSSSGVVASDLDVKNGDDGWGSYQALAPGQPQGPIAVTPSGGYHLLHQPYAGIINFTHKGEYRGIDFRGGNSGYIVLGPSTIGEVAYQWVQSGSPQPLPEPVYQQYIAWSTETRSYDSDCPDPADISTLKPLTDLPIPQRHLDFLLQGELDDRFDGDRSAALLGAAGALYRQKLSDEEVLAYLEDSYAMEVAAEHRPRGDALEWLWKYTCLKARESLPVRQPPSVAEAFSGITHMPSKDYSSGVGILGANNTSSTGLEWTEGFTLSKEDADRISNPKWLYENLIIQGHVVAIVAEPNGGKTTILFHIAGELANQGNKVFYVNADISGGDAKPMVAQAEEHGLALLLPDMAGKTMDDVISHLIDLDRTIEDLSGIVFIFDTLKKMTDVINKSKAKELYKLFRSLSAKGMTIVLLAHTNKYKDGDGKPVFEGTGDLRSDVDELIYLIPQKNPDQSMRVSTEPDKVRGVFMPITFDISPDRIVTQSGDYYDVAAENSSKKLLERDASYIEVINNAIDEGSTSQAEIIEYCINRSVQRRTVLRVLKEYSEPYSNPHLWVKSSGLHNRFTYTKVLPGV